MRILIVTDFFPPESYGGVETQALTMAQGLQKAGQEVVVFTTTQKKGQTGWLAYKNLPVFRFYSKYHPRWRAYKSLYNRDVIWKFWAEMRRVGPEVVHFHNIHTHFSYYALKLARQESGVKVLISLHDVMSFHYGKFVEYINPTKQTCDQSPNYKVLVWKLIKRFKRWYNPSRNTIIRHHLKYAHKRLAVSYELKKALEANKIENIEVLYNSIDIKAWQVDFQIIAGLKERFNLNNKKVVLFGGRISVWKGSQQIIDIMRIVVQKVPDAVLVIMGEKNKVVEQILEQVQNYKIDKHIITTGYLTGDNLRAAYQVSDVVVMPSICFDTFGLACLEGMVCQKPVVTTCFGGSQEVVKHGITGYVANPYNLRQFAGYIIEFLQDSKKARQFGERGYRRAVEVFASQKIIAQLLGFYKF